MLICGYPHLQMLNTKYESFGLDKLKHNPETWVWQARRILRNRWTCGILNNNDNNKTGRI